MDPVIGELRQKIRSCDLEILRLLSRRFSLCLRVGHRKKELGLPVLDMSREKDILDTYKEAAKGTPLEGVVGDIFPRIFEVSRNLQQKLF